MPTVRISKIKVRRGSDNQRKFMVFDQGELVYTTDTKRLFVGTGTLSGGSVIGSKIHPLVTNYYSISNINAQVGDLVNVNNKFYQLTATDYSNVNSWADVSLRVDSTFLSYDDSNTLSFNMSSISASYINPTTVGNGIKIEDGVLQSDYNTRNFQISANQIIIRNDGINEYDISSDSLSSGITGGSGQKLRLDIDTDYFVFDGNKLSLSAAPTTPVNLEFSNLSASWFGQGLVYDIGTEEIYATLSDVDNTSIVKDLTGGISIKNDAVSGTNQWAKITVDQFGRVTNQVSAIYGALTGNASLSSLNVSNSLSSIFNGTPSQSLSGAIPGLQITQFTATDINGYTVTLSSAGFITFESPTTTRTGQTVGRFAIPIFAY